MEKEDKTKTKLLDSRSIKVTDKDLHEFNLWIKGGKINPELRDKFDSDLEYEDFMLDYDPTTTNFSDVNIPLDKAGTYVNGSKEYEYLNNLEQPEFEQLMIDFGNNGLKLEYDSVNDEFKVFCESVSYSNKKIFEPGTYDSNTKEYKELESISELDWEQFLDDMAKNGLSVEYDNLNDSFVITSTLDFSDSNGKYETVVYVVFRKCNSKDQWKYETVYTNDPDNKTTQEKFAKEYEKQGYEVGKTASTINCDAGRAMTQSYIIDQVKQLNGKNFSEDREKVSDEDLEKAKTEGVIQKKPNGKWGIISIQAGEWWIPDYDDKETAEAALAAYHANKSEKTYSDDMSSLIAAWDAFCKEYMKTDQDELTKFMPVGNNGSDALEHKLTNIFDNDSRTFLRIMGDYMNHWLSNMSAKENLYSNRTFKVKQK